MSEGKVAEQYYLAVLVSSLTTYVKQSMTGSQSNYLTKKDQKLCTTYYYFHLEAFCSYALDIFVW